MEHCKRARISSKPSPSVIALTSKWPAPHAHARPPIGYSGCRALQCWCHTADNHCQRRRM